MWDLFERVGTEKISRVKLKTLKMLLSENYEALFEMRVSAVVQQWFHHFGFGSVDFQVASVLRRRRRGPEALRGFHSVLVVVPECPWSFPMTQAGIKHTRSSPAPPRRSSHRLR